MTQDSSAQANQLAVVILAAGKGTRMHDPQGRPKVLVPLNNRALIDYVLDQANAMQAQKIVPIVGHEKEAVIQHVQANAEHPAALDFAIQLEQNGTGHALMQTSQTLQAFEGDVLILSGDVPLLRSSTLHAFRQAHISQNAAISVLSVEVPDPAGYGRIVRNAAGDFERIVEHKDATDAERKIAEINSGIYLVDAKKMFAALARISNDNAQGELYLTDIIGILYGDGEVVRAWQGPDWQEVQGVNTREQLLEIEQQMLAQTSKT